MSFEEVLTDYLKNNKCETTYDLNVLCGLMGYHCDENYSPIESFIEDNPGCINTILNWMCNISTKKWTKNLQSFNQENK